MSDARELHFIAGILSFDSASKVPHESIANPGVQERREAQRLPSNRRLHSFANLYFDARNPMLECRRNLHKRLCVLRVVPDVVLLPGTMIADRNAAAERARFVRAPEGLSVLDKELVFAQRWDNADRLEAYRRRQARCAEGLVPTRVATKYVTGAFVSGDEGERLLRSAAPKLATTVDAHLFFRGERP